MTRQFRVRWTLAALLMVTMLRVPVALMLQALLPAVETAPAVNYAAAIGQSLLFFAIPGWLLKPSWETAPSGRRETAGWLLLALGAAVTARAVISPLNAWWAALTGASSAALPEASGLGMQLLQVLAVAVVPAMAEEVFFRGALLTSLLRTGSRWQAVLLTTLMFALMHGSVAGLWGHLLISLLLTLLMVNSGCLLAPVVAHMAFNLLALGWPETAAVTTGVCGLLLVALLVILLLRMPRGQTRRLPAGEGLLGGAILLAMLLQYLI